MAGSRGSPGGAGGQHRGAGAEEAAGQSQIRRLPWGRGEGPEVGRGPPGHPGPAPGRQHRDGPVGLPRDREHVWDTERSPRPHRGSRPETRGPGQQLGRGSAAWGRGRGPGLQSAEQGATGGAGRAGRAACSPAPLGGQWPDPPGTAPTGLSRPRAGRARCLGDQVRASLSERGHCAFWAPPGTRGSPVRGGRGARPGGGASRPGSCSLSRRERPQGRTRESSCRDGCWGRRQGLPHLVGLRGLSGCPRRPPDRRV